MASDGRKALVLGALAAGLALAALAVWVAPFRGAPSRPPGAPAGRAAPRAGAADDAALLIRNVTPAPGGPVGGRQEDTFETAWPADTFPGVYRCTFTADGADGSEVGTYSDLVVALAARATARVWVPVTSPAASVRASCGDRLDVGGPYGYELTDLRIGWSPTTGKEGVGAVEVRFDARWLGSGQAGPVQCVFSFVDGAGTVVTEAYHPLYAPWYVRASWLVPPLRARSERESARGMAETLRRLKAAAED